MQIVSNATKYNWRRLNTSGGNRLTSRANKTASQRQVTASAYLRDSMAERLLVSLRERTEPLADIMMSLCRIALAQNGILGKEHVRAFISRYDATQIPKIEVDGQIFTRGLDVLGFIYQSLMAEGRRNSLGVYYTLDSVAEYIAGERTYDANATVLDPCCGSGSLLLNAGMTNPENLYGFDVDPIAVMIASVNLLIKYKEIAFIPRIYERDFLRRGLSAHADCPEIPDRFDFIVTNPPWGADRGNEYKADYPEIRSGERSSMVIAQSIRYMADGGRACFLLPVSLLNVDAHKDIRKIILDNCRIAGIHTFNGRFDGVYTRFFAIDIEKKEVSRQEYDVKDTASAPSRITLSAEEVNRGIIRTESCSVFASNIIGKVDALGNDNLAGSQWALGIVTGDNKNKVLAAPAQDAEPIVTGKDVAPLCLSECKKYVVFNPEYFQQCAPVKMYRAQEKLIYRFIARYPVVAYDDRQRLCLNSANIVIPDVETLSVKSVCVLLNSYLYRFYYQTRFSDIKVLKKNMASLPFPKVGAETDKKLAGFLDKCCAGIDCVEEMNEAVFSIFGISEEEKGYIKNAVLTGK